MSISIALNFLKNKPSVGFFAALIPVAVVDFLIKLTPLLYVTSLGVGVLIGMVTAILKVLELEKAVRERIKKRNKNETDRNNGRHHDDVPGRL